MIVFPQCARVKKNRKTLLCKKKSAKRAYGLNRSLLLLLQTSKGRVDLP
jgi:hypothetical protein